MTLAFSLPIRSGPRLAVVAAMILSAVTSCGLGLDTSKNAPIATDWTNLPTTASPTNGGDWFNRRYSPLTQINRQNVASLKAVWRTRLGSGMSENYSGEAQPLFADGVLYIVTGADDVFAIEVETGAILWSYKANLDPAIDSVCCGWTSRGSPWEPV